MLTTEQLELNFNIDEKSSDKLIWDPEKEAYVYKSSGRKAPEKAIYKAVAEQIKVYEEDLGSITDRFLEGTLSFEKWQEDMAINIRNEHVEMMRFGKGGEGYANAQDYMRVSKELNQVHFPALQNFSGQIRRQELSEAQIKSRTSLYARGSRASYEQGRLSAQKESGAVRARRKLGACDHCPECVTYAARGWQTLEELILPTKECSCRVNCCCSVEYEKKQPELPKTLEFETTIQEEFENLIEQLEQVTIEEEEKRRKATKPKPKPKAKKKTEPEFNIDKYINTKGSTVGNIKIASREENKERLTVGVSDKEIKEAEASIQKAIDNSTLMMRVPDVAIMEQIIEDGRFKSQFETNTSKGLLSTGARSQTEQLLFNYPEDTPPDQRPVYAYLADKKDEKNSAIGVDGYGKISVRFKNKVKQRTTITTDDSLVMDGEQEYTRYPSPAKKFDIGSLRSQGYLDDYAVFDELDPEMEMAKAKSIKNIADLRNSNANSLYIEAQVHGQLKTNEIEEIVFFDDQVPSAKIKKWAKENNVKIKRLKVPTGYSKEPEEEIDKI